MTNAADTLTHMDATFVWERLSQHIDDFVAAWQDADSPPKIAEFLPAGPPALRRLALVELIKVDLEQRQNRKLPRRIDEYMAEFPELLEAGEPPVDLIYEELHVRRSGGDEVRACEKRQEQTQIDQHDLSETARPWRLLGRKVTRAGRMQVPLLLVAVGLAGAGARSGGPHGMLVRVALAVLARAPRGRRLAAGCSAGASADAWRASRTTSSTGWSVQNEAFSGPSVK